MLAVDRVGPYDIIDRRAEGTSVLCLASDPSSGRRVLVRLLAPAEAGSHVRERLLGELQALALVQHRNLVEILDVIDAPDALGLVTEALEGETLAERAAVAPLDLRAALDTGAQVCAGLEFAHRFGLVHGRLHADQVCITSDGTAKILNLGLALVERLVIDPRWTAEQMAGATATWRQTDVRRAGSVVYLALTGREPSRSGSLKAGLLAAARSGAAGSGARHRAVLDDLAPVLEGLLVHAREPRPQCLDLAALGRTLTVARLSLDEPLAAPAPLPLPVAAPASPQAPGPPFQRPARPVVTPPVPTRAGPVELGTVMVPMPPVAGTAPRHRREAWIWSGVAALGVAAIAAGVWFLPPAARPVSAPRAAPSTWTLSLDSDPQGATVFVGGTPRAERTPLDLALPVGQDPRIELSLEGYVRAPVPVSETVRIYGRVRVPLRPEPRPPGVAPQRVRVTARASYAFELLQGGRVVSRMATDHSVNVQAFDSIQARSPEHYLDRSYRVPPEGLTLALPPLAPVSVHAPGYDDCAITIGSQVTPHAPGKDTFLIPAGSYQMSLACRDGRRPPTKTVAIRELPLNTIDLARP